MIVIDRERYPDRDTHLRVRFRRDGAVDAKGRRGVGSRRGAVERGRPIILRDDPLRDPAPWPSAHGMVVLGDVVSTPMQMGSLKVGLRHKEDAA